MPTLDIHPVPAYAAFSPALFTTPPPVDAVYVHVPFCSTKCHYCDFYSLAGHLDESEGYLAALERELTLWRGRWPVIQPRTVFIGGGTPTLLSPPHLRRLLAVIRQHVDLSGLEEFTVEANPNTFDGQRAAILFAHGVNRLSFGAQSFQAGELATLQRDHDPESVPAAFETARRAGFANLSLDLIFGIPGQTLASWDSSLSQALALRPTHVSCYSLTYEPNTAMTARLKKGEFQPLDEDLELEMFQHVFARLSAAGFWRYEVSNYARQAEHRNAGILPAEKPTMIASPSTLEAGATPALQDYRCQHNLAYWKAENWLGLGPSAGSHVALAGAPAEMKGPVTFQWKNVTNLTHYTAALSPPTGVLPITQLEQLSRTQWAAAAAVFWLRLAEGLNYEAFARRTGVNPRARLEKSLRKYEELALVELTEHGARILDAGVPVSNRILRDALGALEA